MCGRRVPRGQLFDSTRRYLVSLQVISTRSPYGTVILPSEQYL